MSFIIFILQILAMFFLVLVVPPATAQIARSLIHDRGYSVSLTDAGVAACVVFLLYHGFPPLGF